MHLRPSQAAFFAFDVPTSRANDPINISTRWKSGGENLPGEEQGARTNAAHRTKNSARETLLGAFDILPRDYF